MRLQKYLAHAGICSRRKAEAYILDGRVKVNHQVVTELGVKVDPDRDTVEFQDRKIFWERQSPKIYIALNKPAGVVSSCVRQDVRKDARIVLDLVDSKERIYPVGRLDKDSQGLLLLTNDGALHNRLSHPSFNHEKEYIVTTVRPLSDDALNKMAAGMLIENEMTRKARVKRVSGKSFRITLKQGRNRQIRKMVAALGTRVHLLKRIRIANIRLGSLKNGKWRHLSLEEIRDLTRTR